MTEQHFNELKPGDMLACKSRFSNTYSVTNSDWIYELISKDTYPYIDIRMKYYSKDMSDAPSSGIYGMTWSVNSKHFKLFDDDEVELL